MLNLTYLRTFIGLVETKNFTKTAHRLGLTQPGVSQHLKALEEYYAIPLVIRGKKSLSLTPGGERLFHFGQKLFAELFDFHANIGGDNPHQGLCRFASPGSFGIKMYSFLLTLQQKHPNLIVHYEYRPNAQIIKDIAEERLDVGFVSQAPTDAEFDRKVIDQERLCLVVPSNFKNGSFANLKKIGLINHPDCFHYASRLLLANYPKEFNSMNEIPQRGFINQITRIPGPVAMGMGFTALPEYAALAFPEQKKIRLLPLKKQVIDPITAIWKRGRQLPSRFDYIFQE